LLMYENIAMMTSGFESCSIVSAGLTIKNRFRIVKAASSCVSLLETRSFSEAPFCSWFGVGGGVGKIE